MKKLGSSKKKKGGRGASSIRMSGASSTRSKSALAPAGSGGTSMRRRGWQPLIGLERETGGPQEATLKAARETPTVVSLQTQVQCGLKKFARTTARLEGGLVKLGSEPWFSLAFASILYNPPKRKISIFVPTTSAKFRLKFPRKSLDWDTWLNGLFRHHLFAQATFLGPGPASPQGGSPPSLALIRQKLGKAKRLFLSLASKPHETGQSWASSFFASTAPVNPRLVEEERLLQDLVEILRLLEEATPRAPLPPTSATPATTDPPRPDPKLFAASPTPEPLALLAPSRDGAGTPAAMVDDMTSSCSLSSSESYSPSSGESEMQPPPTVTNTTTTTASAAPVSTTTAAPPTPTQPPPTSAAAPTPTPATTPASSPATPAPTPPAPSGGQGSNGVTWRERLPVKDRGIPELSLGLLLRSVKEGTLPLEMFEPLSSLQRLAEMMEGAELLDRAVQESEPLKRTALVTAFAMSTLAGSRHRIFKPFNPLVGETFALDVMEERGWRWVSEQVSHSPDVSAFHAEGAKGWTIAGVLRSGKPKTSFSYVSIVPTGRTTVTLPSGERLEWNPLEFLLLSPASTDPAHRRLEHVGTLQLRSSRPPNLVASLLFSRGTTKVAGHIHQGKSERAELRGLWNESLNLQLPSQPPLLLFKAPRPPSDAGLYFGMGRLSRHLNQVPNPLSQPLPCTDSRHRPDQRAFEEAKVGKALELKRALEKAQRERKEKGATVKPIWFTASSPNDLLSFHYNQSYWQHSNQHFAHSNTPPIFTISPSN